MESVDECGLGEGDQEARYSDDGEFSTFTVARAARFERTVFACLPSVVLDGTPSSTVVVRHVSVSPAGQW